MSFDPVEIKLVNGVDEDQSDYYCSLAQLDNTVHSKGLQRLCSLQQSILQRINQLTEVTSLERSIKNVLDNQFGKLNYQINEINQKISLIFNKLDQKQKQSNCNNNSKVLEDKHPNVSLEGCYSGLQNNLDMDQEIMDFTNAGLCRSYLDSYADEQDQSIMLIEGENNYSKLFQSNDALFHELQEVFIEMDLKFQKCQKLYDYEQMKEINFHEKIDKKMDVFLLMELENNELLGAFTHLCFDPQPNYIPRQNPKSFFCNLKKNIFVYASRHNKTHSYDKNYLIFGNWEIKIKAGEQILATNWGTNGDCFMNKYYGRSDKTNIKLEWMFGVGFENKQIKMKKYCIYQFT